MFTGNNSLFLIRAKKCIVCFKTVAVVLPIFAIVAMLSSCVSASHRIGDNKKPFIDIVETGTESEAIETIVQGRKTPDVGCDVDFPDDPFLNSDGVDIGIDLRVYKERWTGKSYAVVIDSDHEGVVRDDVILSVNGSEVSGAEDVENILADSKVGDTVSLVILRQDKKITVEIVLKERQTAGVFFDE